jgi:tyrosyl-tRNA synthetase
LQVGGSDQWGNSIAGADLIRRVARGQAFVLVTPLITASEGTKMGKSEKTQTIWLNPHMTSPYEYYQYWRNVPDSAVERSLAVYTFLPMEEVRSLSAAEGAELNRAKEMLAFEATTIVHGADEARKAQDTARALFRDLSGDLQFTGELTAQVTRRIERDRLAEGIPVTELFKEAGLVSSANEARSLISQRGLSINGQTVTDPRARIGLSDMDDGHLMLSRGRKRHMRIICA